MALKTFKPTSPGRRHLIQVDRSQLWKGGPIKALVEGQNKNGGRGNTGRITSRRKGGGHKTAYRLVDFRRTKFDVAATVERIEYDPNRTAFIALIKYADGELSYILAPQRLAVGDQVVSGQTADVKPGNAMPLGAMPVGTIVHNVETKPGKGGSLARSAGTYALVAGRVAMEGPGRRELAELVTHHVLRHGDGDELVAIVHLERQAHELRQDGGAAAPRLDSLRTATGAASGIRLFQEIPVDERAFPN